MSPKEIQAIPETFRLTPVIAPYSLFEDIVPEDFGIDPRQAAGAGRNRDRFKRQLSRGQAEAFDGLTQSMQLNIPRENSWRKMQIPYQRYSNFVFSGSETVFSNLYPTAGTLVAPVGQYGSEFSGRLLETTKVLLHVTQTSPEVLDATDEIYRKNKKLLLAHTARGYDAKDFDPSFAPMATLQESIISTLSSMAFLTPEQYERQSGDELVQTIADRKLPSSVALISPMGFLGPVTLRGVYISGVLEGRSNPTLSRDFLKAAGDFRRANNDGYKTYNGTGFIPNSDTTTGIGCPVARKTNPFAKVTGTDAIGKAFANVHDALHS